MSWIKLDGGRVVRLKKFSDLKRIMGWDSVFTLGFLASFWSQAIEVQEDGNLTKWTPEFLCETVGLKGVNSGQLWAALKEAEWIDEKADKTVLIHDWLDHAGPFLTRKYGSSGVNRLYDIWQIHNRKYGDLSVRKVVSRKRVTSERLVSLDKIRLDKIRLDNITTCLASPKLAPNSPPKLGEYKIETGLQKVVCGWKLIIGYKKDDRIWDKANWSRTSASAKTILDFFEADWKSAIDCCQDIYDHLQKSNLTCTIETVVKHMDAWKLKNGKAKT